MDSFDIHLNIRFMDNRSHLKLRSCARLHVRIINNTGRVYVLCIFSALTVVFLLYPSKYIENVIGRRIRNMKTVMKNKGKRRNRERKKKEKTKKEEKKKVFKKRLVFEVSCRTSHRKSSTDVDRVCRVPYKTD